MKTAKADVLRWAQGQRLAGERTAAEGLREPLSLTETLNRIDDLRELADALDARVPRAQADRDNLAFHRTWARARRAFGLG